jgi:hypothetical protein
VIAGPVESDTSLQPTEGVGNGYANGWERSSAFMATAQS